MAERFYKNGQVQNMKTSGFVVESRGVFRKKYFLVLKWHKGLKNIYISDKSFTEASASVRLIMATALDWRWVEIWDSQVKMGRLDTLQRFYRVSNRPDLGGTVPILTENPESRLDLSRNAKCPDFEKQRSCREVIDQKIAWMGYLEIFCDK